MNALSHELSVLGFARGEERRLTLSEALIEMELDPVDGLVARLYNGVPLFENDGLVSRESVGAEGMQQLAARRGPSAWIVPAAFLGALGWLLFSLFYGRAGRRSADHPVSASAPDPEIEVDFERFVEGGSEPAPESDESSVVRIDPGKAIDLSALTPGTLIRYHVKVGRESRPHRIPFTIRVEADQNVRIWTGHDPRSVIAPIASVGRLLLTGPSAADPRIRLTPDGHLVESTNEHILIPAETPDQVTLNPILDLRIYPAGPQPAPSAAADAGARMAAGQQIESGRPFARRAAAHHSAQLLAPAVKQSDLTVGVTAPALGELYRTPRLPERFAAVARSADNEPVAVVVRPVKASSADGGGIYWSGFELTPEGRDTGARSQIRIMTPMIRPADPAPGIQAPVHLSPDGGSFDPGSVAGILERVMSRIDAEDTRYVVHDVARYWDEASSGASAIADATFENFVLELQKSSLEHRNWKIRFTYKGVPLDGAGDPAWSARDQDLAAIARKLLVGTGAHASEAFPADAHVIGDLTVSQVKAVARQQGLPGTAASDLSGLGLSGAVISQDFGLRPAAAVLMLQLALATPEPVEEGDPALDLLRLLTSSRLTAEEANWLREGRAGKIAGYGDWNKFSIVRLGARLAKRISDAAMSAIMSATSA